MKLARLMLLLCTTSAARADYESTVTPEGDIPSERAQSRVDKSDIERRQSRSSPDALRWEPGVFVQQSAHGQGSAYLRGLTGQQTVLLFDGIRLNNSTYRQGPNQYFFTIDSRTLSSIEVQRGGASTRFGSDALGGAIEAMPTTPFVPDQGRRVEPRLFIRGATADKEIGGRAQVMASGRTQKGIGIGFLGGVGARQAGLLEGRPVENPNTDTPLGRYPWVPRLAEDGRTQLGTGFKEITGDARLVIEPDNRNRVTVAAYLYQQYDVPRTDHCPAPTAPYNSCLIYEQQFRHLAYATWEGDRGRAAQQLRVTLSWQQQHEKRRLDMPGQFTSNVGIDDVDTIGLVARAHTALFRPRPRVGLRVIYGLDNYLDLLRSHAEIRYSDVMRTSPQSRGQYLDGSLYLQGGVFGDLEVSLPRVVLRGGGRVGWAYAQASADPQSGTKAVDRAWIPVAAHLGVEAKIWGPLSALLNVDRSYRAPNLDDLTSRQQTGPGFQFENADLKPEQATTFEAGLRLRGAMVTFDLWGWYTLLEDAILRQPRTVDECPPETPQCNGSWSRFQLINAPALSYLRGVEGAVRLYAQGLGARATLSYAWGEGPRVGALPSGLDISLGDRVPISRVPPLNGTVEIWYTHRVGVGLGAAMRWAALQDRLALVDYSDGRIPRYGTPGFIVVDARAWYRHGRFSAVLSVENLFDSPYRYHGSSVNGAARGAVLSMEALLR